MRCRATVRLSGVFGSEASTVGMRASCVQAVRTGFQISHYLSSVWYENQNNSYPNSDNMHLTTCPDHQLTFYSHTASLPVHGSHNLRCGGVAHLEDPVPLKKKKKTRFNDRPTGKERGYEQKSRFKPRHIITTHSKESFVLAKVKTEMTRRGKQGHERSMRTLLWEEKKRERERRERGSQFQEAGPGCSVI